MVQNRALTMQGFGLIICRVKKVNIIGLVAFSLSALLLRHLDCVKTHVSPRHSQDWIHSICRLYCLNGKNVSTKELLLFNISATGVALISAL